MTARGGHNDRAAVPAASPPLASLTRRDILTSIAVTMTAREAAGPGPGSGWGGERGGRGVRGGIAEARARKARSREPPPGRAVATIAVGTSSLPATGRETGRETKRARRSVPSQPPETS